MTNNEILKADLLDLVFDNRNKQYGAYALRKTYPQRLLYAVSITALGVTIILWMLGKSSTQAIIEDVIFDPGAVELTQVELPKMEEPKPLPNETPKTQATPVAQEHFMDKIEIVKDHLLLKSDFPDQTELERAAFGTEKVEGPAMEGAQQPAQVGPVATEGSEAPAPEPATYDFHAVEEMAQFPGGMTAFQRYLGRSLAGSDQLEPGVTKKVVARFVIGKDGSILDITLLQSGGADLDEKVVRVLKRSPRWKPARQNDRNVAVVYTLPVTFVGEVE